MDHQDYIIITPDREEVSILHLRIAAPLRSYVNKGCLIGLLLLRLIALQVRLAMNYAEGLLLKHLI